jgi:hypothetical protein
MPIDSLELVDQARVRVDTVKHASGDQALRQQFTTDTEKGLKAQITAADRPFWVSLSQVWSGWRETLVIVQLNTVARRHCKGFRFYWRSISKRGPGRPPIPAEGQALIRRFADENGWHARKIQAELGKLGIIVGISAMHFLFVHTARFRSLYAWFVIGHGRRKIIHIGVDRPSDIVLGHAATPLGVPR